jgi:hypothetical protein
MRLGRLFCQICLTLLPWSPQEPDTFSPLPICGFVPCVSTCEAIQRRCLNLKRCKRPRQRPTLSVELYEYKRSPSAEEPSEPSDAITIDTKPLRFSQPVQTIGSSSPCSFKRQHQTERLRTHRCLHICCDTGQKWGIFTCQSSSQK